MRSDPSVMPACARPGLGAIASASPVFGPGVCVKVCVVVRFERATPHLCFNATRATHTPIGPVGGLEMHPRCAWGLLGLLNETYRPPYRHPGGLDDALRAMTAYSRFRPLTSHFVVKGPP